MSGTGEGSGSSLRDFMSKRVAWIILGEREKAGARWLGPQSLLVGVMGMNEEEKVVWLSSPWFALLGELRVPTQR